MQCEWWAYEILVFTGVQPIKIVIALSRDP
jgi:hypothetical protein